MLAAPNPTAAGFTIESHRLLPLTHKTCSTSPTARHRGREPLASSCVGATITRLDVASRIAPHTPPSLSSHASTVTPLLLAESGSVWSVPVRAAGLPDATMLDTGPISLHVLDAAR